MAKVRDFEKLSGMAVKRSGPLVAIVAGASDPKAAQAILAGLEYKADFIWNQAAKAQRMPDVGGLLVAIFELTGVLLLVCVGGGILFAYGWTFFRRRRIRLDGSEESITILQLRG